MHSEDKRFLVQQPSLKIWVETNDFFIEMDGNQTKFPIMVYTVMAQAIAGTKHKLVKCHDCGARPGEVHQDGCDVERCSACGGQRVQCDCAAHDPLFARWTGLWPGLAESELLGITLNDLITTGAYRAFFVKPPTRLAA